MKHSRVLEMDKEIREALVDELLKQGFTVGVFDGVENTVRNCSDAAKVKAALGTVDVEYLRAFKNGKPYGHLMLVYGECGYDVICNYTCNLDCVVNALEELTTRLMVECQDG